MHMTLDLISSTHEHTRTHIHTPYKKYIEKVYACNYTAISYLWISLDIIYTYTIKSSMYKIIYGYIFYTGMYMYIYMYMNIFLFSFLLLKQMVALKKKNLLWGTIKMAHMEKTLTSFLPSPMTWVLFSGYTWCKEVRHAFILTCGRVSYCPIKPQ